MHHTILAAPAAAASTSHVAVAGLTGGGVMLLLAVVFFLIGWRFTSGLILGLAVSFGSVGLVASLGQAGAGIWNGLAHVLNSL